MKKIVKFEFSIYGTNYQSKARMRLPISD